MSKYTVKVKLQAVERYLNGNESYQTIAESIGATKSQIFNWVKIFEVQGKRGFKKSYTSYSSEFKLDVLNFMSETGASFLETASTFNISSPSVIYQWEVLLKTKGLDALKPKKKRCPSMKKEPISNDKKTAPVQESIEVLRAENERLRMENAYLKKLKALVHEQEKLQIKSRRK